MKYNELGMQNLVRPVLTDIEAGRWKILPDGRIEYGVRQIMSNGWVNNKLAKDRNCIRWNNIYFLIYGVLPEKCFGCWKVVVEPRTVEELFMVCEEQKKMGFPGKCGIELREYVDRNYGAYWYAPLGKGLEVARKLHGEVEGMLKRVFGEDHPRIILKRGCTEMERGRGPSHLWKWKLGEKELHEMLENVIVDPDMVSVSKEYRLKVIETMQQWIEYARGKRDMSYRQFWPEMIPPVAVDYTTENHGVEEELVEVV